MLLLEHEPPQFSEAYGQSGGLLSISPSGRLVAVAAQHRLLVRDVETQQVVQAFSHDGEVGHAEWSCDSLYVLAVLRGRGLCHVWAVNDAEWYCKVDEGPLGLAHARWAPDGRHVLTSSCHGVRLTVWSLLDRSVCYVRAPKLPVAGVAFSADGRWLAVAERREGADWLGVYECAAGYERACAFEVATHDLAAVAWAPAAAGLGAAGTEASSADWLLVTDGCMRLCALVYRRDGQLIAKLQHDEGQAPLGARLGAWAPAGNMVAVGSYAGEVRVLVARTCHCVAQLCHPSTLRGFPPGGLGAPPLVFAEALLDGEEPRAEGAGGAGRRAKSAASQLQELAESLPHLRALTRPTRFEPRHLSAAPGGGLRLPTASAADEREQALPKIGVRTLEWSPDGRYLATQLEEMPAVLWLWEAASFRLHTVVVTRAPILCVRWQPQGEALAFCSGACQLYLWAPAGMSVLALPDELRLRVHGLHWAPDGASLALTDTERFCWCYLPAQPAEEPRFESGAAARASAHGREEASRQGRAEGAHFARQHALAH